MQADNPYQPPSADLESVAAPIASKPSFSSSLLSSAAWLSIVSMFVSVAYAVESFVPKTFPAALTVAIGIASTVLPIYVMYALVRYVEFRYEMFNLRTLFYVLSAVGLIVGALGIPFVLEDSEEITPLFWAAMLAMPLYGIPYAMFGFRLKGNSNSTSTLAVLSLMMILSGIALASFILAVLSLPLGLAVQWLSAMVLFAGAREIVKAGYP